MTRIKRILLSAMVALGLVAPALVPIAAGAVEGGAEIRNGALACGANLSFSPGSNCDADGETASTAVNNIITTGIDIISVIVGIAAVIMIIVGGFKYITSNGDSGTVSGAKNTILYAIVGLVVVALAQLIVRFVVSELGNGEGGATDGG